MSDTSKQIDKLLKENEEDLGPMPDFSPRRPWSESEPNGYMESDEEWALNNVDLCVWLLERISRGDVPFR